MPSWVSKVVICFLGHFFSQDFIRLVVFIYKQWRTSMGREKL